MLAITLYPTKIEPVDSEIIEFMPQNDLSKVKAMFVEPSDISTPLFDDAPSAYAPVCPAVVDDAILQMVKKQSPLVYLGTCGWGYASWRGVFYGKASGTRALRSPEGLKVLAQSPLVRCVSLERGYQHPYSVKELSAYAEVVSEDFRFLVRAPKVFTSAFEKDHLGRMTRNDQFLSLPLTEAWVEEVTNGLGSKLGVLLFEVGPFPVNQMKGVEGRQAAIEALEAYFTSVMPMVDRLASSIPVALEVRNPTLLTPRLMRVISKLGVRLVVGLNGDMPGVLRQMRALQFCDAKTDGDTQWQLQGPLVIRWQQGAALRQVRRQSELRATDPVTRAAIASLIVRAVRSQQPTYVVVGEDAEGSAPETLRAILTSIESIRRGAYQRERG